MKGRVNDPGGNQNPQELLSSSPNLLNLPRTRPENLRFFNLRFDSNSKTRLLEKKKHPGGIIFSESIKELTPS